MRTRSALWLFAAAAFLAAGAGAQQPAPERQPGDVKVYEMIHPYSVASYEVVDRLWVGSWRTALRLPTYSKKEDAIAAMQAEAAKVNAEALINTSCVDQQGSTWFAKNEPDYICYAVAVRMKAGKQ